MRINGTGRYEVSFAILSILAICAPTRADAPIFRCVIDEVVTFSDRPCSRDADEYVPSEERISTVKVEPVTAMVKATVVPRKKSRTDSIAADQAKHKQDCARIETSLRNVRSQMRAGYDAKQGERLKERQRKLNEARRVKRC